MQNSLILRIKNFRSIEHAELHLNEGLNILIGPNGSGKSNIVAAVRFLRETLVEGVGIALAKSGGSVRNYRRGSNLISFSVEKPLGMRNSHGRRVPFFICWNLEISQAVPEQLASISREEVLIVARGGNVDAEVFFVRINREEPKPKVEVKLGSRKELGGSFFSALRHVVRGEKGQEHRQAYSLISSMANSALADSDRSIVPKLSFMDSKLGELHASLTDMNEYNIQPDIARRSTDQLPFAEISPNGAGLSEVIHALSSGHVHRILSTRDYELASSRAYYFYGGRFYDPLGLPGLRHSRRMRRLQEQGPRGLSVILDRINSELALGVRSVDEVSTAIDPANGRRFVIFKSGNESFRPEEVSDGTIKWLSILTSIFVPYSSTYVLEEPENFLHPWMQQQLIRIMREQSAEFRTIFMVTTHSSTILNSVMPEEVIVVGRPNDSTVACRLNDRESIVDLLDSTQFGLGDLWVSGAIGGVPGGES